MRTTKIEGFTFHHTGDFSGKVAIALPHDQVQNWPDHAVIEVPFAVIAELVGRVLQRQHIAEIEEETGIEFLGLEVDVDSLPEMQDEEEDESED